MVPFVANIARLVALVLVGAYVSPEIGAGGFHSYAGTLLFCGVALATVALALRSRWLSRPALAGAAGGAVVDAPTVNVGAPYLVPFLAVVVAGLLSRAFSVDGRDPLYVLRPLVGIAALAAYGSIYRQPAWRPLWRLSWFAVPAGLLVAALWLGVDRLFPLARDAGATPAPAAGALGAVTVAARVLATVLVVPIVEELAFRGFLARRVSGAAFNELAPQAIGLGGILISSLAFGLLHRRPLAGILAGVCYALAFRARGRLADAVVAHATTNLVLLVIAWLSGAWGLWM